PTNSSYYLPLPGILLGINELAFLLLPIVNVFCFSKNRSIFHDRNLKVYVFWFLSVVIFTEFVVKYFAFGQSFSDAFKTIRVGLPLISSLVILSTGIKADVRLVWKTMLITIGLSIIISLVSLVIPLPIYHNLEEGTDALTMNMGRIANANASFGVVGLYLLFRDKGK